MVLLCAAFSNAPAAAPSVAASAQDASNYQLLIGGHRLTLPKSEWRPMRNYAAFARNFEATSNPPDRQYQVVTVFMIPMSEDRRVGQRLSPTEYLEVFVTVPRTVTVQVRRDHGTYWVMSREGFRGAAVPGVELSSDRQLSAADLRGITDALRLQIDTTRRLLGDRLRAS